MSPESQTDTADDLVLTHVEDGVGVVSLNRPERHNAMSDALGEATNAAIERVFAMPDVRAVVLRGEGKSFCSGRDLQQIGSSKPGTGNEKPTLHDRLRHGQRRQLAIMNSQKPSICVMRGYTVGLGFELALACDMRVANPGAQMWLPEIRMSVLPDLGGAHILASVAGPSRAKYITMTGDRIDAERALAWGIVDFIVPDDELDDFALDLAKRLAKMPPVALGLVKDACNALDGPGVQRGIQFELTAQMAAFGTEDFEEGMRALREKREPNYTGR